MRVWKPLVGVAAVGALTVGAMQLFDGGGGSAATGASPGSKDEPAPGDSLEDRAERLALEQDLHLFRPSPDSFPILVKGEKDVLIREGWLDEQGHGVLEVDTGTTGMTLSDLMPSELDPVLGSVAASALAEAGASREDIAAQRQAEVYTEAQLDGIAIGLYDDSGLDIERRLGTLLVRALGEGRDIVALGVTSGISVFRDGSGGAATVVDSVVKREQDGQLRIDGAAELGDLMAFLARIDEAGRLRPGADGHSAQVSGITVESYGAVGEEKPFILEATDVDGVFLVREKADGAFSELPPIGGFGPAGARPESSADLALQQGGGTTFVTVHVTPGS